MNSMLIQVKVQGRTGMRPSQYRAESELWVRGGETLKILLKLFLAIGGGGWDGGGLWGGWGWGGWGVFQRFVGLVGGPCLGGVGVIVVGVFFRLLGSSCEKTILPPSLHVTV